MKIAFDLRRIGNPGIGRYMKCLVEAVVCHYSDHEYLLILPASGGESIEAAGENVTRVVARSDYYSIREQFELPRLLRRYGVDLLHSPHFLLPLVRPCPAVVTIHDVVYFACSEDLSSRIGRLYYAAMMHASARMATRIITDSVFSKNEIVRYLHINPDRISVVYPAVDAVFGTASLHTVEGVRAKFGIGPEFVLYAGIYKLRKNHAGLLRAFKAFLARGAQSQLVIAGPLGDAKQELQRLAEKLSVAKNVVFTGFIDDDDLSALYSAARVYACPSLYEGFGFTVLEAMACGTPVVCSNCASLPEVAGSAALYADASNPSDFGGALYRAFTENDLRRLLTERGRTNIARFSWKQAATQCIETYADVLAIDNCKAAVLA